MKEKKTEEKLPNIYSSSNNNYSQTKQSISRRNEIIDEYILSMEKKEKGINEISLTSEEDDKDPFSSKAIKNLKPIKKDKNKLILPHFDKRKKLSESSRNSNLKENSNSYSNNNNQNNPKNNLSDKELHIHTKISKNKNFSENNIYGNNNAYLGKFLNNNNSNLNSKWTSSNTYNNYINSHNYNNIFQKNKNKNKINNNNNNNNNNSNSTGKEIKGRSRSHIGNKPSYNLYKDKNNNLDNNSFRNIHNKKYVTSTQVELFPKNINNNNNNYPKNYKRNFTAKILKNKKISILENNKQNKKTGKTRVYSTLNTRKIVENKHQIYEKLINEKNNPYGLGWINKMLGKNNEEKVGLTKGFVNGVPVVKILSKVELSKREIKKRLSEIEKKKKEEEENKYNKIINADPKLNEKELEDEYNIPKEILEQFNKNSKNFFKFRKDIIEAPEEEEGQTIEK